MDIKQLSMFLEKYENKEFPIIVTGNNSFSVDITDMAIIENGKTLLLYENSYYTKTGKYLLSPVRTIRDLSMILDTIEDKSIVIKGRGTNGVLVSPTDCRLCYIDDYTMLELYDKSKPITINKAKKDVQIFIDNLHND